jgi:hypothetical protein
MYLFIKLNYKYCEKIGKGVLFHNYELSTWRKTCSIANMTTTNLTRNGLMSITGFQVE